MTDAPTADIPFPEYDWGVAALDGSVRTGYVSEQAAREAVNVRWPLLVRRQRPAWEIVPVPIPTDPGDGDA